MTIKLVRHGESQANTGELNPQAVGDASIPLTETGQAQARAAGLELGREFLAEALIYCSPYRRARETLAGILEAAGLDPEQLRRDRRIYEDPRLREVDHGYKDVDGQQELRQVHGWFYYRYEGGESPADCFDRTSGFLETLMRQVERKGNKKVLVVTHGLTMRCFVMRFFHLSVEAFERMQNPRNAEIITIAPRSDALEPPGLGVLSGRYDAWGLRLYDELEPNA